LIVQIKESRMNKRRKNLDRWRSNLRWKKMNHRRHINKTERESEREKREK
jgi:hypothetical protein